MPSNDLNSLQSLPLYTKLFFGLGWLAAGGAAVAIILLPLLNRLSREHRRCAEAVRRGTDPYPPAKPASLQ
jgi:POT family proton-dependent oligopeptide transporter